MKISSLPCQLNVIAIPVSELYRHWFHHQNFAISDILYVMVSCDSQAANARLTVSIVVAVVAMYGEHWLAWLPKLTDR